MRGTQVKYLLSLSTDKGSVRTGQWVGDCFVYTNSTNRLNYLVGDQTYTISHFDQAMYVLGYLPRDGRIYLADKDVNIMSYALSLSVVEYQTLVLRGDMDAANEMLADIQEDQKNKIARFLEGQGYKEQALEVATDPEHRFELALSLDELDIALDLARKADIEHKWRTVGDAALSAWKMALAEECFKNAKDLGALLLLYTSSCNGQGLRELYEQATMSGANNIAFSCLWQLADLDGCIDLLVRTNRLPEAVLFSQTYKPSRTPGLVVEWKQKLEKDGKGKISKMIGVPPGVDDADDDLFPDWGNWANLKISEKGVAGEKEGEEGVTKVEEHVNGTSNDGEEDKNGEKNG